MKLRKGQSSEDDDEPGEQQTDSYVDDEFEYDEDEDLLSPEGTPWRFRNPQAFRNLFIGAGVALLAAVAFVVVVLRPLDTTPDKIRDALAASRRAVLETAVDVNSAEKLRQIRVAAAAANSRIAVVDRSIVAVSSTNDLHYERPALAVLNAEKSYLQAIGDLQVMGDRKLRMWKASRRTATIEQKKIDSIKPLVAELDVAEINTVMPTNEQLESPLEHLDTTISAAARKIGPWLRRLFAAKMRQKAEIAAYSQYGDQFGQGNSAYEDMRTDTENWSSDVSANGSSCQSAGENLAAFYQARSELRDRMSAAQAPPGVESSQDSIVTIIGQSMDHIQSAGEGIGTACLSDDTDYRDTTGWQNFQSGSADISNTWPSARAAWQSALDEAIKLVRRRSMPERPNV
jgi:hypothetical protein